MRQRISHVLLWNRGLGSEVSLYLGDIFAGTADRSLKQSRFPVSTPLLEFGHRTRSEQTPTQSRVLR